MQTLASPTYLDRLILACGEKKGIRLHNLGMKLTDIKDRHDTWDAAIANSLKGVVYNHPPVPIKEFIESPAFLNKKGTVYPKIMAELEEINSGKYVETVFTGGIGPLSADTEFLTPQGWVRMDGYVQGMLNAEYHLKTGGIEFREPSKYEVRDCDWFYKFESTDSVDMVLSPKHRVLYQDTRKAYQVIPAEELARRCLENEHGFSGKFITTFNPPEYEGVSLSEDEIRLQVACQADGSFDRRMANNHRCRVHLKKQRKKARLEKLLKACNIEYLRKDIPREGYHLYTFNAPLRTKTFEWAWGCSKTQLEIIISEINHWGGSFSDGRFATTGKKSADFVQYAYSALGLRSVITSSANASSLAKGTPKTLYRVGATARNTPTLIRHGDGGSVVSKVPSEDGKMYCFATETKFFVARYNGKIFITGNSGKTTAALYTLAYQVYVLSCMTDPHAAFGLDASSEILIVFQSLNARLAKALDFNRFKSMIDGSPYFKRHFPYNKSVESRLDFPNRISVVPLTGQETAAIGQNVISGLLDELNYMSIVEDSKSSVDGGNYDQAMSLYNSIARRRKSRFSSVGMLPGMLCLVSSKRYPGQFTDIKEEEAKTDPTIYIYDKRVWDVKPAGSFCGTFFQIFVGDEGRQPRIMGDAEYVDPRDRTLIDSIPIEYKADFERDIINSLREIAGKSTLSSHPFIINTGAITTCMDRDSEDSVFGSEFCDFVQYPLFLQPENFYKPKLPRAVHIDLGITGDSAGLAIGTIVGFEKMIRQDGSPGETLPKYHIDGCLEVRPPKGGEILFWKIRSLILKLRELGLNIKWVSLDSFQCLSIDTLIWTSLGYKSAGDIAVGDVVQSRVGSRKVTAKWEYGIRPCLRITTSKGQTITITEGHKLEAATTWHYEGKLRRPTWGWVKGESLVIGDTLRVWDKGFESSPLGYQKLIVPPKNNPNCKDISLPSELTEDVAEVLGLYFGDGSFGGDTLQISCPDDRCEETKSLFSMLFGVSFSIYKDKRNNAGRVCKSSSLLLQWFKINNLIKADTIPQKILASPLVVQAAFIRGIFSTDGCVSGDYGVIISNTKIEWLRYIQHFCYSAYGMQSAINIGHVNSLSVNRCYNLRFKSRFQFRTNIGATFNSDAELLAGGVQHPMNLSLNSRIVSIEKVYADVVDFEVEEDHAYIANGFVSHNSRDTLQILRQQGITTGELSIDRTMLPYETLKTALYDHRISMPKHAKLRRELASLEKNVQKGKVDHPSQSGSSKDIADGLAGIVHTLISRREIWAANNIPIVDVPESVRGTKDKMVAPIPIEQGYVPEDSKFTEEEREAWKSMR